MAATRFHWMLVVCVTTLFWSDLLHYSFNLRNTESILWPLLVCLYYKNSILREKWTTKTGRHSNSKVTSLQDLRVLFCCSLSLTTPLPKSNLSNSFTCLYPPPKLPSKHNQNIIFINHSYPSQAIINHFLTGLHALPVIHSRSSNWKSSKKLKWDQTIFFQKGFLLLHLKLNWKSLPLSAKVLINQNLLLPL